MRITFIKSLIEIVRSDKRVMLITGDLGFSVFEEFQKNYPRQYLNPGVAEQSLTGIAAGLALEGKIPFIYSIVPFITMRNFEQIRNDICYQNLNVKIIGVGAGLSYGIYGHTHYGLEDISLMRILPNMTVFSPGDPVEVAWVVSEAMKIQGPCYIRLGKVGEPIVHKNKVRLKVGKGAIIQDGKDLTIMATGVLLPRALEVASLLKRRGFHSRIVSIHTIQPLDEELIVDCVRETKAIFTLEEHFIQGGLGTAVAEVIAEKNLQIPFRRFGVLHKFFCTTGSQEYMRSQSGLTADQLAMSIESYIKKQ